MVEGKDDAQELVVEVRKLFWDKMNDKMETEFALGVREVAKEEVAESVENSSESSTEVVVEAPTEKPE